MVEVVEEVVLRLAVLEAALGIELELTTEVPFLAYKVKRFPAPQSSNELPVQVIEQSDVVVLVFPEDIVLPQ